ncbi:hypothetical protein HKX48_003459 [Thoreauomyces humboldtii]|nr:hypothetical protein HKX48_003459 [Thoreauomyces humboldtii]
MTAAQHDVRVYQSTEVHDSHTLHFQIMHLQDSLFAWAGADSSSPSNPSQQHHQPHQDADAPRSLAPPTGNLTGLAVAMPTRYESAAISTVLLPVAADDPNERIAKRLATKHAMQVFVALDLPLANVEVLRIAERRLAVLTKEVLGN